MTIQSAAVTAIAALTLLAIGNTIPEYSHALTHASIFKAPLVTAYPDCGIDDDSTSKCCATNADCDLNFPITYPSAFTFDRGTISYEPSKVGIRLDKIQVRTGRTCPVGVICVCENNSTICASTANCTAPYKCVMDDNESVTIEIWLQQRLTSNHAQCIGNQDCISRGFANCHTSATVSPDIDDGNININQIPNFGAYCQQGSGNDFIAGTIRRIEIRDPAGELLAMPSADPN
jgi:hypothetical protein